MQFANNQWKLVDEIGSDPTMSSFHKALTLSVGTIHIVDQETASMDRIWVGLPSSGPPNCCGGFSATSKLRAPLRMRACIHSV